MMTSNDVLVHYDPKLPLLVACDASPYGRGAVLSHRFPNGDERPIAYASRTLAPAERNYSQIDKEALGIVWAVKKFSMYLLGRQFILVTDHQPLVSIFNPQRGIAVTTAARLQRYALYLAGFQYTIEFKGTKNHGNADGLSRLPMSKGKVSDVEDSTSVFFAAQIDSLPVTAKEIRAATRKDPLLSKVYDIVLYGTVPAGDTIPGMAAYVSRRNELSIHDGCLLWSSRVIIPEELRRRVLDLIHEGHVGMVKMKAIARSYVWWPGLDSDLEALANECQSCLLQKNNPNAAPVHPWEWPQRPWQRIHADFAGPCEGTMFLLVVDAYSKWPEVVQMPTTTSSKTIEVFREIFSRNGIPETLVTDNGPQFCSEEFKAFMRVNGIHHITSSPYHPRTNGLAERLVKTFKQAFKTSRGDGGTIQRRISNFLLSYRTTPHSTTNTTPAFLFLGRALQTRLSLVKPNLRKSVESQQARMYMPVKQPAREFCTGETVQVRDYRANCDKWIAGEVTKRTGPISYQVDVGGSTWRRHTDQMIASGLTPHETEPVRCPDTFSSPPPTLGPPVATKDNAQVASPTPKPVTPKVTPRKLPFRTTRGIPAQKLNL